MRSAYYSYRPLAFGSVVLSALIAFASVAGAAEGRSLLSRLGIAPRYTSSYGVSRQETDWKQSLAIQRQAALNTLAFEIQSSDRADDSRNNLKEDGNRVNLTAGRTFGFAQGFFEGLANRQSSETTNSRKDIETNKFDLGTELPFLKRETFNLGLTARAGYLEEGEIERQARGRGMTVDSTSASGWSSKLDLKSDWAPSEVLTWSGSAGYTASQQDSRTLHSETDRDGQVTDLLDLSATDRAHAYIIRNDMTWTQHEALQIAVTSSLSDDNSQFYTPIERTQETQEISRRSAEVNLAGQVTESTAYGIDYSADVSEFDYAVQSRDRLDRTQTLGLNAEQKLGLPLIAGTTIKAGANFTSGRHLVENTMAYDTRGKQFSGELQRPFGQLARIGMRATMDLTQDFYDDGSLDKDLLRTDFSVAAAYTPSETFRATGGYTINRRETVNIPSERAADNQVQYNYQVKFDYETLVVGKIGVKQSFQISTAYTYKVANDAQNTLSRTNRVTTGLRVPLWDRSLVCLDHIFHLSDTGAYTYPEYGESRTYTKASKSLRQNLKLTAEYSITSAIKLKVEEIYDLNYRTTLATDITTLRDKLTFAGEVDVQQQFRNGILVKATVKRTSSTQEEDFWDVDAQLEKTFN